MDLGLAGALSGAGEAGTRALATAQVQYGASKMQEERDKMENLRLDKQLAFQERMQGKSQGHAETMQAQSFAHSEALQAKTQAHAEGLQDKGFKHAEEEAEKGRAHDTAKTDKGLVAHAADTDKHITSNEKISVAGNLSHKEISAATNKIQLQIANIQKEMYEKQYDKTFTAARLGALKDTVRELGNEITRLSVVASNPLADKKDPSYKALMLQLDHATKLHNLYSQEVGLKSGVGQEAITAATTEKELPSFRSPTSAKQSGGMVTVPNPDMGVSQGMIDSVQRLKDMQK